jgi:hypothetical protein
MAAGQGCVAKGAVTLSTKLQKFSWTFKFFIFDESSVLCILGVDFLAFGKVQLDFASSSYSFAFDTESRYMSPWHSPRGSHGFFSVRIRS